MIKLSTSRSFFPRTGFRERARSFNLRSNPHIFGKLIHFTTAGTHLIQLQHLEMHAICNSPKKLNEGLCNIPSVLALRSQEGTVQRVKLMEEEFRIQDSGFRGVLLKKGGTSKFQL